MQLKKIHNPSTSINTILDLLATLASYLTNISHSPIRSLHCLNPATITSALFAVSVPTLTYTSPKRAQPLGIQGGQDPLKIGTAPTFNMIRSPHPSFESPGAATATVPTTSSTLAPSVPNLTPQLLQHGCALDRQNDYHLHLKLQA